MGHDCRSRRGSLDARGRFKGLGTTCGMHASHQCSLLSRCVLTGPALVSPRDKSPLAHSPLVQMLGRHTLAFMAWLRLTASAIEIAFATSQLVEMNALLMT
jgi:hypothetical protein